MPTQMPTSRRHLLLGGLGMLASGALPGFGYASTANNSKHAHWPVGVQLWAVNDELKTDIPGTLQALKRIGYATVETAGLFGHSPGEFRKKIEEAGLTCRGAHANMGKLMDGLQQNIDAALALGATWLVCSAPKPLTPIDPNGDWVVGMTAAMTLDAWKFNAEQLARMAPEVTKAGLKFAYHNHPMEFIDHGGVTGYDLLIGSSDSLRLEMDMGWVQAGGRDPVTTLKTYGHRVDLLHVKDMVKDLAIPAGYRSVEVGKGMINWPGVFAAAHAAGVKGYFIEQESPFQRPALESLQISHDYVRKL